MARAEKKSKRHFRIGKLQIFNRPDFFCLNLWSSFLDRTSTGTDYAAKAGTLPPNARTLLQRSLSFNWHSPGIRLPLAGADWIDTDRTKSIQVFIAYTDDYDEVATFVLFLGNATPFAVSIPTSSEASICKHYCFLAINRAGAGRVAARVRH